MMLTKRKGSPDGGGGGWLLSCILLAIATFLNVEAFLPSSSPTDRHVVPRPHSSLWKDKLSSQLRNQQGQQERSSFLLLYSSSLTRSNKNEQGQTTTFLTNAANDDVAMKLSQESYISKITAYNLAGIVNDENDNNGEICIDLCNKNNEVELLSSSRLVAVSGETGSGKSLLIAKVANLVIGGKATSSFIPKSINNKKIRQEPNDDDHRVRVEMEIKLGPIHREAIQRILKSCKNDVVLNKGDTLRLKRTLIFTNDATTATTATTTTANNNNSNIRLKSACEINGIPVTLRELRMIASPLIVIVDATTAAMAFLSSSKSSFRRLAILDTGLTSPTVLQQVQKTQHEYTHHRKKRKQLEDELSKRILPSLMHTNGDDDDDLELLQHWVDELNVFGERINNFCQSIKHSLVDDDIHYHVNEELSQSLSSLVASSNFWFKDKTDDSFCLYTTLLTLKEGRKILEEQYNKACMIYELLGSLSNSQQSIMTMIENSRNLLFDVTSMSSTTTTTTSDNNNTKNTIVAAGEKTHDALNHLEESLQLCLESLESNDNDDNNNKGALMTILNQLRNLLISFDEQMDILLSDWNIFSRKHGISPYTLQDCHEALLKELNGGHQLTKEKLLPKAIKMEKEALQLFQNACRDLSQERIQIAKHLSHAVTKRLPSLAMEGSTFQVQVNSNAMKCTDVDNDDDDDNKTTILGTDSVDFFLHHGGGGGGTTSSNNDDNNNNNNKNHGGKVEEVASSGEKARLLLAMECELPGSIGATCGNIGQRFVADHDSIVDDTTKTFVVQPPPVAVIYDEIDSHVGGQAAVAMAEMLANQANNEGTNNGGHQVIAITHTPSVAAVADLHLVIQKKQSSFHNNKKDDHATTTTTRAFMVNGIDRQKELARMASGDLATKEAQIFAQALLRDGAERRKRKKKEQEQTNLLKP